MKSEEVKQQAQNKKRLSDMDKEKKGLEKHDLARTGRMALYGGGKLFGSSPTIAGADNTVAQLSSVPLPRPGSNSCKTKWC